MRNFLTKFRIPTLLGLAIIFSGIASGVFLTLQGQNFISKASPDQTPQNITLSNISDDTVALSWTTTSSSVSFVNFGVNSTNEHTVLDDRDSKTPKAHIIHYVTIKDLLPKTEYQYRIISGNSQSETDTFTTASPLSNSGGFRPIIGSVLTDDIPLDEGVVYLSISNASIGSSLIRDLGNFLIPLSQIRKSDLSDGFPLTDETIVKLTVLSPEGESTALFKLRDAYEELPPLQLGEDLDLTILEDSPEVIIDYDLNGDGKINSNDISILLQNIGKNPKNPKYDLNLDGVVDQKDLSLLGEQINQ
ncbi:hypothetical protein A3C59_02760 [Candidatus Daviesbacteria bacterium RIFCSPHIGHO2_02_FULL_36_13]|uniref:Fibronectin type-III domain-containing protein n=1 Tax=Candidatus Daviesbacteria bacterium RIFCSPHIGHO2_02_FULL_36_13 TaxID=1797768 RepID=A0A1F5JWH0_9BACT|nr:MAG: hypothetical protein A3C59_02760 [Candidatus Daviesbacteria bacterium RIFCSPHIGHO2_02_FULL_36_13]